VDNRLDAGVCKTVRPRVRIRATARGKKRRSRASRLPVVRWHDGRPVEAIPTTARILMVGFLALHGRGSHEEPPVTRPAGADSHAAAIVEPSAAADSGPGELIAFYSLGRALRSALAVPIANSERLSGVLTFCSVRQAAFTPTHQRMAEAAPLMAAGARRAWSAGPLTAAGVLAVAAQLDDVAGFLAVLAAVLSERPVFGNGAVTRRMRALVRIHDPSSQAHLRGWQRARGN
jgi:hypothetical protein